MCTVRGFFSPRLGRRGLDCEVCAAACGSVAGNGGMRGIDADLKVDEGVVGVGE